MQYSEIMIRYGELSTKGKNRMRFINKLRNNISDVLSIYPQVKVTADRDRAHAYLNGADYAAVAESLKQVFGIQNFSPVYKVEKSVEVLKSAVQEIMKGPCANSSSLLNRSNTWACLSAGMPLPVSVTEI